VQQKDPDKERQELMKLFEAASQTGAVKDPEIIEAFELLHENPGDSSLMELLVEDISLRAERDFFQPDPFRRTNPTKWDNLDGEVKIGIVLETQVVYSIPFNQLPRHMLVLGKTGGGKTNLIFLVALSVLLCPQN